jgi:hypothetical protein
VSVCEKGKSIKSKSDDDKCSTLRERLIAAVFLISRVVYEGKLFEVLLDF